MPAHTTGKERVENAIQQLLERAHHFFDRQQWDIDLAGLSTVRAIGVKLTRILSLAWQGMVQNDCLTRASALTYVTVLSLVPLLAFAFSVAKGLGAYEYLRTNAIDPALEQGASAIVAETQSEVLANATGIDEAVEPVGFASRYIVGSASREARPASLAPLPAPGEVVVQRWSDWFATVTTASGTWEWHRDAAWDLVGDPGCVDPADAVLAQAALQDLSRPIVGPARRSARRDGARGQCRLAPPSRAAPLPQLDLSREAEAYADASGGWTTPRRSLALVAA